MISGFRRRTNEICVFFGILRIAE